MLFGGTAYPAYRMSPRYLVTAVNLHRDGADNIRMYPDAAFDNNWWLGPLTSLNVFIGPNNSGKSRLLRTLFTRQFPGSGVIWADPACVRAQSIFRNEIASVINPFRDGQPLADRISQSPGSPLATTLQVLMAAADGDMSAMGLLFGNNAGRSHERLRQLHSTFQIFTPADASERRLGSTVLSATKALADKLTTVLDGFGPSQQFYSVYVPILRGLRPLSADEYLQRTTQDYFSKLRCEPNGTISGGLVGEIVTGQGVYGQVNGAKRGSPLERRHLERFESFLSRAFFDGDRVEITASLAPSETETGSLPDRRSRILHVKVGREKERPIHELGDGIAHLLMMTLPMFLHRDKNLLLFIEEPELFLHPGYQRLLIKALLEEPCAGSRQVFVATHSQHFMDITLESDRVSVFHCQKSLPNADGDELEPLLHVRARSNGSLPILRELGVLNSSVLLANCTIWVEGITDRMYLRHYLSLYQDHCSNQASRVRRYVEDLHYAFVEYGGSNVTHWSFLDDDGTRVERLCGELILVADDDGVSTGDADSGKQRRHTRLREFLSDRFVPIPCREIENLLLPEVISAVVRDYEREELLALKFFEAEAYRHKPLGHFIESQILPDEYVSKRSKGKSPYSEDSGTIKDKVAFAAKAIGHLKSWESLSLDAQKLTEVLYAFVAKKNGEAGQQGA